MARTKNKAIKKYKLKNGELRYMFKVYQGMDSKTGKRRETTRRGFLTYREAEIEYEKLKANGRKNIFVNNLTYQDIYEDWLKIYKKGNLRPTTVQKTEQYFKNHILPQFGHLKITKIDYYICLEAAYVWYEKLKYNKKIEHYANKVFVHALNARFIDYNPLLSVETPIKKLKTNTIDYYTRQELIDFLESAKNESLKKYAYLRTISYLGLRRAEGFALIWSDVDFDKKMISINKAVTRDSEGKLILGPTKTGEERILHVDDKTLEILKEWRTLQTDVLGTLDTEQLIFPNKFNEIAYPSKAYDWCSQIVEKYKLKYINPHGLRRTHATLYRVSGADYYDTKRRLGHSFNDVTSKSYIMEAEELKYEAFMKFVMYMNY
ncbi:MAG: site-specific integrase [Psychrobacillus sp.]